MMGFYGGLSKQQVLKIHAFALQKRRETWFGQTKLCNLVRNKFGLKINESTISGWIFRGLIPFANEITQFKPKPKPSKKELLKYYKGKKISAEKLGKKYRVSTIIVINWLKSYGVPTRTHLESMNTPQIKKELREKKLRRPTKAYDLMTPAKAYILGVLCGDGCLTKRMVRLEIRYDKEFISEFVRCFEEVYGFKYKYNYYKPRNSFVAQMNSEIIAQDLASYGNFKTWYWGVPKEIIKSCDEKVIGSFLRGFYDSEGSVSRSTIHSSSVSEKGLKGISILLQKLGIKNKIRVQKKGKYFVLYIFRKGRFEIFKEKVGFTIKRKNEKISEILNTGFFTKRSVA